MIHFKQVLVCKVVMLNLHGKSHQQQILFTKLTNDQKWKILRKLHRVPHHILCLNLYSIDWDHSQTGPVIRLRHRTKWHRQVSFIRVMEILHNASSVEEYLKIGRLRTILWWVAWGVIEIEQTIYVKSFNDFYTEFEFLNL